MSAGRLGVFVCRCGGNISDHVDVDEVRAAAEAEDGVAVARAFEFACSDAAQEEMVAAIRAERLDAAVVASCSPKLHLETFRGMARRAGLNPHMYTQVNLREQCSWAHRHRPGVTEKAKCLTRAGIARARLGRPLDDIRIETVPSALVVGAGPAGMRAALALAGVGLAVHLVEREAEAGGRIRAWGRLFPRDRTGAEIADSLLEEIRRRDNIVLYTGAEVVEKKGSVGDFLVKVKAGGQVLSLRVGAIVVATGFDPYSPVAGELGRGLPGVLTLPEFKELLASAAGTIRFEGRPVRTIAYVYCVGSREPTDDGSAPAHPYCSRYCCTAAVHSAVQAQAIDPELAQYHLYRDMRTYGKHELLFEAAGRAGSVFLRFPATEPPVVEADGDRLRVRTRDELAGGEAIEVPADLVVLVTGMVARENARLHAALKLPAGAGGFFNEIHPKLRPVETVIDGVFIAGAAQGPKTLAESVTSALAAAAKSSALLLRGFVDLPPLAARVDPRACNWCEECARACPWEGAITEVEVDGRAIASVRPELCKGCGACAPVCAAGAIELEGYGDAQMMAMIDAAAGREAR